MALTPDELNKLKPRSKEYTTRDSENKGFAVRVRPTGSKSFFYIRTVNGKVVKTSLGSYPDVELDEALSTYKRIIEGKGVPRSVPSTVSNKAPLLSEAWRLFHTYRHKELARNTMKQYGELIDDIITNCGDLPLDTLGERVEDYLFEVDETYKAKGNRIRATLSSIYKTLRAKRVIRFGNPLAGLASKQEFAKTRKLSKVELKETIQAVTHSSMSDVHKFCIHLALLTGQRPSEVSGIEGREVDLETKRWILPKERTKNGREHLVPLSEAACKLIEPYIHPNVPGRLLKSSTGQTVTSYSVRQALQRTQVANAISPCSIHDLRRTMAHHLNSLGVDSGLITKLLNHTPQGVTAKHYIQASLFDHEDAKRAALELWSETLIEWGL